MVRIKGANSDYVYVGDPAQPIEERKDADPLYLKIFICPYDMPSSVEPNDGAVCEGTDADCPHGASSSHAKDSPGHALISLHQYEGIKLVADQGNQLVVDNQSGHIRLAPTAQGQVQVQGQLVVQTADGEALLTVSPQGIAVQGPITLNQGALTIQAAADGIHVQADNGAEIQMTAQGDIELTPHPTGSVKVHGNLDVTGEITAAGQSVTPSPPLSVPSFTLPVGTLPHSN